MKVISDEQLDFDDVSIEPKRSSLNSRSEVELVRTYAWTGVSGEKHTLTCKPMCVANMGTVGTPEMAERVTASGYLCALEKHLSKEEVDSLFGRLESKAEALGMCKSVFTDLVAMSIGIKESLDNLVYIDSRHKLNIINLDAPNGYCPNFTKRLTELRNAFPEAFIIAGTVVTGDIVTDLIMKGANAVRVGICCGSACTTALKTGVRRPVISMIMDCADAAHNLNGYVMQDGGIRYPADWCKALVAGADFCMSGSIFAGTDAAKGEIVEKRYLTDEIDESGERVIKTKKFKRYYGMSSDYAQKTHFGGIRPYRTSEGREKLIPYTGKLEDILKDYEGGLASMMCYIGARKIKHIPRHGSFYKVRHQINDKFAACEDF